MEYGNFSLSEQPETIGIKGWDASYNRVTTWAILQEKNNGQKFVYFNTHLDNDGKTARKEGVQLILDKIKEIAPTVRPGLSMTSAVCRWRNAYCWTMSS